MAARDEISSTERLLGIIKDNSGKNVAKGPPAVKAGKGKKSRFGGPIGRRKDVTVGIDFGSRELRLVKVKHFSEEQKKLVGYEKAPFDPQMPKDSPDFSRFLRRTLEDFCGSPGKAELWCALPSSRISVRQLLIPKIPRKQIPNAVLWSLRKESQFDTNETFFDFKILGDHSKEGVSRTDIIAWTAPKEEVRFYRDLFDNRCGYPLTGLSLTPFAIQNLIQTNIIRVKADVVGSLYVGREHSRIDIFQSGNLVMTRRVKTGLNSMIESIIHAFNVDVKFEQGVTAIISGTGASLEHKQAERILQSVGSTANPLVEGEAGFGLEKADIYKMIAPALRRLVRQVDRTFKNYSINSKGNAISKLFTVGTINSFGRVVDYIGNQAGLSYEKVDPLETGKYIIDKIAEQGSSIGRSSFIHAAGMAVSEHDRTPNLLFTHEDKERQITIKRTNMGIFVVFFIIISGCMGFFLWQGYSKGIKESRLADLRNSLEKYSPRVDHTYLMQLSAKAKLKQQTLKEYSKKYMGLAVVGEISRITTPDVRLLNIKINLGGIAEEKEKAAVKNVTLEGIIRKGGKNLESSLAEYLLRLENSPIFTKPTVRNSNKGYYNDEEAIQFTVNVELI